MRNEGSTLKTGVFYPTKTTGVYFRLKRNGSKTFYARRPDGSRSFEACDSFEAAKSRRAEFVGKVSRGEVIGSTSRTLNGLIEDWQALRTTLKPRSREEQDRHVRLHIKPALGRMKVREINRAVLKQWLALLNLFTARLSDAYGNRVMSAPTWSVRAARVLALAGAGGERPRPRARVGDRDLAHTGRPRPGPCRRRGSPL